MALDFKEHKNHNKVNSRPIFILLIGLSFMTLILLASMLSTNQNGNHRGKNSGNPLNNTQVADGKETTDTKLLAVVKEIDTQNKRITLFDVDRQEALVLDYTGGTNITDKYGQVIAMSQIEIGSMVDATYRQDKNRLTDMNISTKAWEYVGVNNLGIDREADTMKIATTLYKYNKDLTILDGQEFIPIDDLAEQDEVTIWGNEETIWSITVTRGHGRVVLEDYEPFLGDNITIGYESMQQITDNMVITVREGLFNLTVENGAYSATKSIRVNRNQVTYVSLADLGPDAPMHGQVVFDITPFGADLNIDGVLTSYANPIELLYGKHDITVSLGGYTSYDGVLNVDSAGKTIKIDLPENSSTDKASVTETNTQTPITGADTGTGTDTTGTSGSEPTVTPAVTSSADQQITDPNHKVYVQNPVGASVYLDGEYMGASPCNFNKIIGSHVLTFIQEGYETMSYTVEIADDGKDQYITMPALNPNAQ